jgi:membrane-associated protein
MEIIDFILHIDVHMASMIAQYGFLAYGIIFLIIFAETGLVVAPFLPGDSLLFAVGAFSGAGHLNLVLAFLILTLAGILGDTTNYLLGRHVGAKAFARENSKIFKPEYLLKTQNFYAKYGAKAIVLARFLPILRTFAPFVAGVGKMDYVKFIVYNVLGSVLWVSVFLLLGYFFGQIAVVKNHFQYAVLGIIFLSFLPMVWEYIKYHRNKDIT